VAEFRRRGDEGDRSPPPRRRFGESRYSKEDNKSRYITTGLCQSKNISILWLHFRTNFGRYGEEDEDGESGIRSNRFRSRFLRPDDDEEVGGNRKSLHLEEEDEGRKQPKKERVKVIDTDVGPKGPLSGCIRLADSSRIIQRLKVKTNLMSNVLNHNHLPSSRVLEDLSPFLEDTNGINFYIYYNILLNYQ